MGWDWERIGTGLITGGLSEALPYATGQKAAEKQAEAARGDINASRTEAIDAINSGYGSQGVSGSFRLPFSGAERTIDIPSSGAFGQLAPIAGMYDKNIGAYTDQAYGGLNPATSRNSMLSYLAQQYPGLSLPEFNFNMEEDPVYQFQQQQMENALARRMAAGGQLNSSDMNNALTRGTMDLAGRYGNDMFNRSAQSYGMNYGRLMDQYGAGVNRSNSLFDRNQQLFGNEMSLSDNRFNRLGGLVGMGVQGKTGMANLATGKAQTLANLATGTGTQLANIGMDIGGLQVATSPLNSLAAIGSTFAKLAPMGR